MKKAPGSKPKVVRPPREGRDVIHSLAKLFEELVMNLTPEERDHLGLELLDAVRKKDETQFQQIFEEWVTVASIRRHPDFKAQTKEYENLLASGDIFEGIDLAQFGR